MRYENEGGDEGQYTVRELLTEMKDISEVVVDLAYASLLFDSQRLGRRSKHLESRMDVLNHEIRSEPCSLPQEECSNALWFA